ncbi:hypothetical protein Clacol_000118 [Clathrus columnatus]|uniref:RDD domain-containing protein n=1 Tax=Clathrus columnatus TaxID=1419009 RepID=A0AAV5A036_9AGAM|nr:hypothetical protein Clacol_000118 [Clathrus columnatus]
MRDCIISSFRLALQTIVFIRDIATILLDALALVGVIYQAWGIWKFKRSIGLQINGKNLVTSLLRQGVLRFCFVLLITATTAILTIVQPFTIALRRRNMKHSIPNLSDIHLPTLSSPSQGGQARTQPILGRIHESLLAEMEERSDPMDTVNSDSGEPDVDDSQHNSSDSDNLHANVNSVTAI